MNRIISVFDTSVANYNIGNEIIMDAVVENLDAMFPDDFLIRLPVEDIGRRSRSYNRRSMYSFVGGTNILNCNVRKYSQWSLNFHNALILRRMILMGCGWWRYEDSSMTKYTKWALKKVLSKEIVHSVRDTYTLNKCESELGNLGFRFLNTGCPTLWSLNENIITSIPRDKGDKVVFTITDYSPNVERDKKMVLQLKDMYKQVYFFPQGTGDMSYLSSICNLNELELIRPRLEEFNAILDLGCDYVGTRLHAGIRALQRSARSFIIGIDNRALEMKADFSLPVVPQEKIDKLSDIISTPYRLDLSIPWENIREWKRQFIVT